MYNKEVQDSGVGPKRNASVKVDYNNKLQSRNFYPRLKDTHQIIIWKQVIRDLPDSVDKVAYVDGNHPRRHPPQTANTSDKCVTAREQ